MPLVDFLRDYGEAVDDAKARRDQIKKIQLAQARKSKFKKHRR